MFDIDCHIIIHKEPKWKIDRCLASLEGQPVNLHFVAGEDGDFPPFKGRAKGYAIGSAPYVCFADPDDWVEPNAFELLNANLGADLVYGKERVWRGSAVIDKSDSIHHLYATKRALNLDLSGEFRSINKHRRNMTRTFISQFLYNWDITGGRYG